MIGLGLASLILSMLFSSWDTSLMEFVNSGDAVHFPSSSIHACRANSRSVMRGVTFPRTSSGSNLDWFGADVGLVYKSEVFPNGLFAFLTPADMALLFLVLYRDTFPFDLGLITLEFDGFVEGQGVKTA